MKTLPKEIYVAESNCAGPAGLLVVEDPTEAAEVGARISVGRYELKELLTVQTHTSVATHTKGKAKP